MKIFFFFLLGKNVFSRFMFLKIIIEIGIVLFLRKYFLYGSMNIFYGKFIFS